MVETFVRYTEDFDTLTEVWQFVMERVDEFHRPNIQIQACITKAEKPDEKRYYAVNISGVVNA